MAVLEILEFPDPRLRTKAKPVKAVTAELRTLIDDMLETMYAAPGIGLAATQVNVHQRLLVIDVSEDHDEPQVFINPVITVLDPELGEYDEGCLSVPGQRVIRTTSAGGWSRSVLSHLLVHGCDYRVITSQEVAFVEIQRVTLDSYYQ